MEHDNISSVYSSFKVIFPFIHATKCQKYACTQLSQNVSNRPINYVFNDFVCTYSILCYSRDCVFRNNVKWCMDRGFNARLCESTKLQKCVLLHKKIYIFTSSLLLTSFFQNKQFTERRIWWVQTRKHNRDNKILTIKTNVATISRNRNRVYVVDDMLLLVVLLLLFFFRFQYFSSDKLAHSLHMSFFGVHKYITGFCWRAIQRTHKRNAIHMNTRRDHVPK